MLSSKKFILFSLLFFLYLWACRTPAPIPHSASRPAIRFVRTDTVLDRSSLKSHLNASEPHITINRQNPANIVGGSILNNVYFSADTGHTWQHEKLNSPYGVYGDPVLISGNDGRIYYFHLASGNKSGGHWLEGIVMQYSDDGGRTWSSGVLIGRHHPKQQDKPWPAIHRPNGRLAVCWTEFDRYGSKNPNDHSRILISFSGDRGTTWSRPVRINDTDGDCLDDDGTVEGAVPLFDTQGNVYVVWAYDGKIWFDYSTDQGRTWHKDKVIATQEAGWNFDIDGIYRANGLPNFTGDDDHFYVVFGDKNSRTGADVRMLTSRDKGNTWSPVQTLGPLERDQFFPAAVYEPQSGLLHVLFYDRSHSKGKETAVRLLTYDPLCETKKLVRVNRQDFTPVRYPFFGDYIGVDAYGGHVACIWTEIHKMGTQIHVAVLKETP